MRFVPDDAFVDPAPGHGADHAQGGHARRRPPEAGGGRLEAGHLDDHAGDEGDAGGQGDDGQDDAHRLAPELAQMEPASGRHSFTHQGTYSTLLYRVPTRVTTVIGDERC